MRVVLADDHAFIRQGIRAMFESRDGWTVCGEAVNGQEAVELVERLKPELVVLDISMPVLNGLQAARTIRETLPRTKIVVLSMHDSAYARQQALQAGADGYITKTAEPEALFAIIQTLFPG